MTCYNHQNSMPMSNDIRYSYKDMSCYACQKDKLVVDVESQLREVQNKLSEVQFELLYKIGHLEGNVSLLKEDVKLLTETIQYLVDKLDTPSLV